jgi:hypothetical protein
VENIAAEQTKCPLKIKRGKIWRANTERRNFGA